MSNQISQEDYDRLVEIQEEMNNLLGEAEQIVRRGPQHIFDRANAYWIPHIESAISEKNSRMIMCSMGDTIDELEPCEEDEDEDDYEEDSESESAQSHHSVG